MNKVKSTPNSFARAKALPGGGLFMSSKASLSWSSVMALYEHLLTRVKGKILLREYLFEELEGAGIVGLAEPEHGLLPHFEIAVGLRDFD